jgi:hypothetical protein
MSPEQVEAARAAAKDVLTTWFWQFPPYADPTHPPSELEYLLFKEWLPEAMPELYRAGRASSANLAARCDPLVNRARAGDWDMHCTLLRLAALLQARGEPLPPLLQEYMAIDAPRFKRPRGRRRGGDWHTNLGIAIAVVTLVNDGVTRTRERRTKSDAVRPTACSIVAEVAVQLKSPIGRTEGAVEKIWERYHRKAERLLSLRW